MMTRLGFAEPFKDLVACPEAVELSVREKDGARWLFLLTTSPANRSRRCSRRRLPTPSPAKPCPAP
jgi:hypothetical protein